MRARIFANHRLWIMVAVAVIATSSAAVASHDFTDVPDGVFYHDDASWLKTNGVTLGSTCPPAAAPSYCPNADVTRGQMAAFLHRLADKAVWSQDGNSATGPGDVLGTLDAAPLKVVVDGERALLIEPTFGSPNLIGGHYENGTAPGVNGAFIGGGGFFDVTNVVFDHFGAIGGGSYNWAGFDEGDVSVSTYATVGGGVGNWAAGPYSYVGGGFFNIADTLGTVGAGERNLASVYSFVGGGAENVAFGFGAMIPGGLSNAASGETSFAAGQGAVADHDGAFVWADSAGASITSTVADQFVARASGGFVFYTNATATVGAELAAGSTAWSSVSDRNAKDNFRLVDPEDVLARVLSMPITTWNYKTQDSSIRHIGPMAQDFHAAFGLGESDTRISTVDSDGVALAAVQGLNAKLERKVVDLEARLARLEVAAGLRCP